MGFLDRLTRGRSPRRARRAAAARERRRTPSFREMHARLRTEKAETKLLETEAKIHEEAARMRMRARPGR
ncbi:hypothetical protein [Actinomadura roseirufa]|uniref:hypothetical protein n=1 Tax=Actinomadura roseirufa TaxID=2094049 RepID=UPI001F5F22AA|nr:hypothetical protein [Actinomadura roseirufa]